ncbi:transcription antitermination factor NusB [Candidatus Uhrbacteria bacterium CG_4_9_14_3_um_filter_50_9]|uniref:Transcription antitermination protein NusB n=1 Tax=Candidatus Uhrbacteria bacterium CG_4_9_14_3_um_filter_50_9 TaxID=1975035 RepID=A0A2M7XBW1_9BACT|nr:MAG: transcription antitermination factor NusB [Candidatus Uhrbacteria bacterium CG_4_9_14_3_um_filter_50_9]
MSNRHLSRTIAMQSLYQWDFLGMPEEKLPEMIAFNREEFAPKFDDEGFVNRLVDGVVNNLGVIDETITRFAPNWPIETITLIDRNILRLGVYELTLADKIPAKVAINEAIELAKGFGGQSSGRFVNGVLGAIYKDMVSRGKVKEVDKQEYGKTEEIVET